MRRRRGVLGLGISLRIRGGSAAPPTEAPDQVTGLTETAATTTSRTLSWDPAARASSYVVLYSPDGIEAYTQISP